FFFSSRRRHTRFSRDWSSDVCSSDLAKAPQPEPPSPPAPAERQDSPAERQDSKVISMPARQAVEAAPAPSQASTPAPPQEPGARSEERRVGKGGRSTGQAHHEEARAQ